METTGSTTTTITDCNNNNNHYTWLCCDYENKKTRYAVLTHIIQKNAVLKIMCAPVADYSTLAEYSVYGPPPKINAATVHSRIVWPRDCCSAKASQIVAEYMTLQYQRPSNLPPLDEVGKIRGLIRSHEFCNTGHNASQIALLALFTQEADCYDVYAIAYLLLEPLLVRFCGDALALYYHRIDYPEDKPVTGPVDEHDPKYATFIHNMNNYGQAHAPPADVEIILAT